MTATLETPLSSQYMHGDEALEIFTAYRHHPDIDDRTRIERVEVEFPWLADELGSAAVFLARLGENKANTFKVRGAIVGAEALLRTHKALQTASAGNKGRSTALVGKMHNVPTRVIVPWTAPPPKREGIRQLWQGGLLEVREVGEAFDESLTWALEHPDGYGFLHPFDDPNVIAGQGTIVDDIVEQIGPVDHIVGTAGGAGKAAGVVKRLAELGMTNTKLHVIEAEGSNSLSRSLAAGELQEAELPNKKYGGSAVKKVGGHALAICLAYQHMLELDTATDREVGDFIDKYEAHRHDVLLENDTLAYEPTSLVPMVKLAHIALRYPGGTIVALGTGHNDALRPTPTFVRSTKVLSGAFPK